MVQFFWTASQYLSAFDFLRYLLQQSLLEQKARLLTILRTFPILQTPHEADSACKEAILGRELDVRT